LTLQANFSSYVLSLVYYIKDAVVTPADAARARKSWEYITNDSGEHFLKAKQSSELQATSCIQWFYDTFYARLFDVHPASRSQFKNNMLIQGRALVHMISGALSLLENLGKLVDALTGLAKSHAKYNVISTQYGIVGEVLLWTLNHCLGAQFDAATSLSWLKIYSVMLKVIIPVAIAEEARAHKEKEKMEKGSVRVGKDARIEPQAESTATSPSLA